MSGNRLDTLSQPVTTLKGVGPSVAKRLEALGIETLQDVMPGIRSKIIVDEQTRSILPLLNLDSQTGDRP